MDKNIKGGGYINSITDLLDIEDNDVIISNIDVQGSYDSRLSPCKSVTASNKRHTRALYPEVLHSPQNIHPALY